MDIDKEAQDDEQSVAVTSAFTAPQTQLTVTVAPAMHSTSNQVPSPVGTPSKATLARPEPVKMPSPVTSPLPVRRISCGDQFVSRQQQFNSNRASYPRATGRQYYIRDRQEDLMANLLSLRDLLLNQNVQVWWSVASTRPSGPWHFALISFFFLCEKIVVLSLVLYLLSKWGKLLVF